MWWRAQPSGWRGEAASGALLEDAVTGEDRAIITGGTDRAADEAPRVDFSANTHRYGGDDPDRWWGKFRLQLPIDLTQGNADDCGNTGGRGNDLECTVANFGAGVPTTTRRAMMAAR